MEGGGGSGQQGGCPNDNSGADARAFVSALLGEGNIMDKEGGSPKENLLVAVAAPAETITAVVVADDGPKEKLASGMNESSYFFYPAPLPQETNPMPPFIMDEEDNPKENPQTPP